MNDLEQQVRELLADDASGAPLVSRMPERVRPTLRRRQTGMVAVAAVTTFAVIAGVLGVIRSLDVPDGEIPIDVPDVTTTRGAFTRTATVGGLTVTSPSDWYLVDHGGALFLDRLPSETGDVAVLEVTNFDPGLSTAVCDTAPGESARVPADGVAILVMAGEEATDVAGLCGGSVHTSAIGSYQGHPYRSVMTIGPDVTDETRAVAAEIWRSLEWTDVFFRATIPPPRYVLDGWREGPTAMLLEAAPSGSTVELSLVEAAPDYVGTSSFVVDVGVPEPFVAQGEMFGAVTQVAASVELRFDRPGMPVRVARLIDLPPSLPFSFDAYVFAPQPTSRQLPGQVQAIGANGELLGLTIPPDFGTDGTG